ncbi:MAG TPA: SRPBCC family protein [Nocardioidaceae bacterium]|nr:SRPBCC family protein [Nocardioidaceae bacterium]
MTKHQRLTGTLDVALPPDEAFALFTPRGEEEWVDGWQPHFPVDPIDDTEPGTVFETHAHGDDTIWVVVSRETGRRISYARVTPGSRAGTVTVELEPTAQGSRVTVGYELTALSDAGQVGLVEFAAMYPEFLRSWETAIEQWRTARAG